MSLKQGKTYVISSPIFDMEFIHGKTLKGKVIDNEGHFICDLNSIRKHKALIYEK